MAFPGSGAAAARAALPSPVSVCSVSVCPHDGTAAGVGDFERHTDVDACDCTRGLCRPRTMV